MHLSVPKGNKLIEGLARSLQCFLALTESNRITSVQDLQSVKTFDDRYLRFKSKYIYSIFKRGFMS